MAHDITKQDHVLFARNTGGWHGLGEVKGDVTRQDLIKHFGYPVTKEPLFTAFGEQTTTFATVRTLENGERVILGDKLSEGYTVLDNGRLITAIDPLLQAGCMVETAGSLRRGARIWFLLRLTTDMVVGKNDVIRKYILVSNDHTGVQAANVGLTPVRVVCNNTLTMAESSNASQLIKIRHTGEVATNVDRVVQLLDVANGQFLAYGNQLDALVNNGIDQTQLDQYVKKIFFPTFDKVKNDAVTSAEKETARNMADALLKRQNEITMLFVTDPSITDSSDARGTVYGAYQAVNLFLNHEQAIGAERRLHSLAWGTGKQTDKTALKEALELVRVR